MNVKIILIRRVNRFEMSHDYDSHNRKERYNMFAIIETGGKQYQVSEGRYVDVELLDAAPESKVTFENIVMLVKKEGVTKELMFINPYDEFKAKWVGAPLSKEEIYNQSGIEDIHYLEEFEEILNGYLKDVTKLYVDLENDKNPYSHERLFATKKKVEFNHLVVYNSQDLFKKYRPYPRKTAVKCPRILE